MRILLLWSLCGGLRKALDPERVAARLQRVFAPLFGIAMPQRIVRRGSMALALLELPAPARRKGGAVHGWQARVLIAPFLNPDFIRAVFGYPDRVDTNAFHRFIIDANTPDWTSVPYYEELEHRRRTEASRMNEKPALADGESDWRQPTGRENYGSVRYWQTVGRPLIREALAGGGFWTEVLDPELTSQRWQTDPDVLPILHALPDTLSDGSF